MTTKTGKMVPTGPAMEVEARLFHGPDAASIYRHYMQQARAATTEEPPLDVTDNRCIVVVEGGRVCGKVVPHDMQHGWNCRYHYRGGGVEDAKVPVPE